MMFKPDNRHDGRSRDPDDLAGDGRSGPTTGTGAAGDQAMVALNRFL